MSNNMFLEFTGGPVTIKGETKDSDHVDWVDIESWNWGSFHPGSFQHGTGGASQAPTGTDFTFTKLTDSSSHSLLQALLQASHIEKVKLEIIKTSSGGTKFAFLTMEFTPAMITGFNTGGSSPPYMEQISIAFGKVRFVYKPQDQAGEPMGEKEFEYDFQASA